MFETQLAGSWGVVEDAGRVTLEEEGLGDKPRVERPAFLAVVGAGDGDAKGGVGGAAGPITGGANIHGSGPCVVDIVEDGGEGVDRIVCLTQ